MMLDVDTCCLMYIFINILCHQECHTAMTCLVSEFTVIDICKCISGCIHTAQIKM